MTSTTLAHKATRLRALHSGKALLVLPNIWNPIGARILEARGYPAVATASAAVSGSLGYPDGEQLRRSTLLEFLSRVAASVEVPLTADIEAGYASTPDELEATVNGVLEAGVAGINIEDSVGKEGRLRDPAEQVERIVRIQDTARRRGVPLVINARVDCFLSAEFDTPEDRLAETIARARAYADAGADCIYPIGAGTRPVLKTLRTEIAAPLNVLGFAGTDSLDELHRLGINRVSFGPFVFRSALRTFLELADGLRDPVTASGKLFERMLAADDVRPFLMAGPE